ncbi:DUF2254 domain-containing protein [Paracoccus sp. Z330]|uniref:DUF2254 domain-containing protein n=1 Tax=Paracoccus onchidii TaxID=3017813 RepID=A0ABT4ZE76_9RHOB|nr:DUF2254 family protein [Paracoccus onchidii]MDB6177636.1 DUF2254 domain-containing protein [Paracoccus onchidii]
MLRFLKPKLLQNLQTLRRVSRILWVRVALITALSVLAALLAQPLDGLLPSSSKDRFSQSSTLPILTILASGMLSVATFSLGVMVASHRTLADQSTPRIHRLLVEDTSTQSMLATFIGAFVFSLCGIILFRAQYYSDGAAVIVFAATVFVVGAVVISLIRWIGQLTRIGSMEYALDRAEAAAQEALWNMQRYPCLGGIAWSGRGESVPDMAAFRSPESGFLCRVDMKKLQSLADEGDTRIYVKAIPGDRLLRGEVLGWTADHLAAEGLAECFAIESSRSVDHDPQYALTILREAGSKALSPGINDQGTALEVVARLERLLWSKGEADDREDPLYRSVYIPASDYTGLSICAFRILARDGASSIEVLLALTNAISRLSTRADVLDRETATALLQDIHDYGNTGLSTRREKDRLGSALKEAGLEAG